MEKRSAFLAVHVMRSEESELVESADTLSKKNGKLYRCRVGKRVRSKYVLYMKSYLYILRTKVLPTE